MPFTNLSLECWLLVFDFIKPHEEFPLVHVCSLWKDIFVAQRSKRKEQKWRTWIGCVGNTVPRVEWAQKNGCPMNAHICASAAHHGSLVVLQWARERGCPWNKLTCSNAAGEGHFVLLQWVRKHSCPWDSDTCERAAGAGNFKILQWARKNGCPWDGRTCERAAGAGHLKILEWAWKNGCPHNEENVVLAAESGGHTKVLDWIRVNGQDSLFDRYKAAWQELVLKQGGMERTRIKARRHGKNPC
jgi:hypothetical protein